MAALGAVPQPTLSLNPGFTLFGLLIVAIGLATLVRLLLTKRSDASVRGTGRAPRNGVMIAVIAGPGMLLALALILGRLIPHAPEGPGGVAKAAMASSPCSSDTPRSEHYFIYYNPGAWADFIALGLCPEPLTPQTPSSHFVITKVQISASDSGQADVLGRLYLGDKQIPNFHIRMSCRGGGRGGCEWRIDGWS